MAGEALHCGCNHGQQGMMANNRNNNFNELIYIITT